MNLGLLSMAGIPVLALMLVVVLTIAISSYGKEMYGRES